MAESDSLIALLQLQHEERFLEYKESCPWDNLKAKIARTSMGMANIRDGGTIIIGVRKKNDNYILEGIHKEHGATYDSDNIQAWVNTYADPYVRLGLHDVEFEGKQFLAIVIHEFDEIPVVCKRNYGSSLHQGKIYTRSHRIPETCIVQSQTEMREIIEMATEKGVRHFLRTAQKVGIPLEKLIRETDIQALEKQAEEVFGD